jgi:branched-chain amino acid transport system ATP-binding protein
LGLERLLELREIAVRYGGAEVVHGVDLRVAKGEVQGLIGPNGAGKSSILRAIFGLRPPSSGEVRFDGKSLMGRSPEQIARLGLALVPEGRQIFKTLSVEENLRLGVSSRREGAIEPVLERFPLLRKRAKQPAGHLSGGEQQQLALARALVGKPRLLIVDEPSLGLAPKMIDAIYELLAGLRDDGVTMLLVEQNVARTMEFCDRCAVMGRGEIRAEGSLKELRRMPEILGAYLGGQP